MDFFFFIGSTYSYLSVLRAPGLAARAGVTMRWRPFNVRSIMIEQDNRPFVGKPVKLRYMWRDLERRARRHGIPFESIPPYPVDPENLAGRVAALAAREGWCAEFARLTYLRWFLEGEAPGDLHRLRALLAEIGRNPDTVLACADSPENRDHYDSETDAARGLGIFGSPTFVVGREIFWGDDRLEDALEWARATS
jgi:2-hydroxychromene-2-carboxylate isomerase